MAGETQKTTAVTNAQASSSTQRDARLSKAKAVVAHDTHQFAAATELEAADRIIFHIEIPSNAIMGDIEVHNDDMDTHACPTLAVDFGVAAGEDYKSKTSGTVTKHAEDDDIDADLFVDGVTTLQAATTSFTKLVPDSGTLGPEDRLKPIWELLGYDEDPKTFYRLSMTSATAAAALGSAADLAVRVTYYVD